VIISLILEFLFNLLAAEESFFFFFFFVDSSSDLLGWSEFLQTERTLSNQHDSVDFPLHHEGQLCGVSHEQARLCD
jgi:hypothetical protein